MKRCATKTTNLSRLLCLVLAGLWASTASAAEKPDAGGVEFFEKRIRPVLVKHCYECHSAKSDNLGGGLRLDSRDGMRQGGESGAAISPGDAKGSLLIDAIEYKDLEMPPEERLPEAVVADFRKWIQMGAPDPRDGGGKATATVKKTGPTAVAADQLWSLTPVRKPSVPSPAPLDWAAGDIDRFVLARLREKNLRPVGDARPSVMLRRLSFDLTGLPPEPRDVEEFQADHSLAAYAALVDRLLDSPRFGERWGRHWLDVARYAESNGRDRDVLMPHAWRYRDWVIDALNADMPFDRFISEQIAGDLIEAKGDERDRLNVATGFLAIGAKSLTGGGFQMDLVDEQIDVVSRAVVGLTVSCARCHDHKFDPIPTRDYYALAGIFRSTQTFFGGGLRRPKDTAGKTSVLLVLGDGADNRLQEFKRHRQQVAQLERQRQTLVKRLNQLQKRLPKDWKDRLKKLNASAKQKPGAADQRVKQYANVQQQLRGVQAQLNPLKKQKPPELQFAVGVADAKKIDDCRIHIRGERNRLGAPAPRGFLSSVPLPDTPKVTPQQSGRRELAAWLTHPGNPLTPRVAVNRVWLQLFGRGIVETVDNFGSGGREPTHPALLDYLAWRFVRPSGEDGLGWSIKRLIRDIVLSRTYRLSSQFNESAYAADPENTLYWRMSRRRMEAEALRDAMLAASGRLNVDRPKASAVARIGDGEVGRGINTRPLSEPFPHRSVYLPIIRGLVPEMLKTFDFPEPSNVQGRRVATTVPAQSLFLLNNPFVIEQAAALAKRISAAEADAVRRIEMAYAICFGRVPDETEAERALQFIGKNAPTQRWQTLCHAMLASAEFRYID